MKVNYHATGLHVLIMLAAKKKLPGHLSGWHMSEPGFYSDQTTIYPMHPRLIRVPPRG
jgi:hypothetical protein